MNDEKTYSILTCLPDNGQRCYCFGHKTYCCVEDMDDEREWHEVIFSFCISSYKLKKEIPSDPEDSILDSYTIAEDWDIVGQEDLPYGAREYVIGVTKWKPLNESVTK